MKELHQMEMPVMCSCGEWFDLNDGYPESGTNNIICKKCFVRLNNKEQRMEEIENIFSEVEIGYLGKREARKELKKLKYDSERDGDLSDGYEWQPQMKYRT